MAEVGEAESLLKTSDIEEINNIANYKPHLQHDESCKPSLFRFSKGSHLLDKDKDALHFGVRMSVCLTTSSLFVLAQVPTDVGRFPEGMWVLITVLFVCWFPTLDAASVLEKSVQRLMGTMIGAAIGLACGFLSLEVEKAYGIRAQAVCLGVCIAVVTFVVCSYAVGTRVGKARFIERKNYATILCLLTFTICLMPFYSKASDKQAWHKSLYRVMNVIIGCILGVVLSMMVLPRPTVAILHGKISKQIELAGESSEAVLHNAADVFAEKTYVPVSLANKLLGRQSVRTRTPSIARKWKTECSDCGGPEMALEKYEEATKEWKAAKAQLGMLKYDPFNIGKPNDLLETFQNEVAQTLARSMRIQTTVVLMDGIIRNDPKHKFSEEHLHLLADVGTLIRSMLSVPFDSHESEVAAHQLSIKLVKMRRMIVDLSASISSSKDVQVPSIIQEYTLSNKDKINMSSVDLDGMYGSVTNSSSSHILSDSQLDDDRGGEGAPKHVQGSHVCSLLFLQLAEHLALRSVRLYLSWKQYNGVCETAEKLRETVRSGELGKEIMEALNEERAV